ncbi:MAG: hypothetical protein QM496_21645 [Verrucomicrobiota bacterium]
MNASPPSIEKITALLLQLLDPIRHSADTLLHSEIDSRALADPIWENFVASLSQTELREFKSWPTVESILSTLLDDTLWPGNSTAEHGSTTPPPATGSLAEWLDRLLKIMQAIDHRALPILALRLEGFDQRDVSEQLETGLRCIQAITREMQLAWSEQKLPAT